MHVLVRLRNEYYKRLHVGVYSCTYDLCMCIYVHPYSLDTMLYMHACIRFEKMTGFNLRTCLRLHDLIAFYFLWTVKNEYGQHIYKRKYICVHLYDHGCIRQYV
jgi:hypothetical protein